jgi:hypothetical protein
MLLLPTGVVGLLRNLDRSFKIAIKSDPKAS